MKYASLPYALFSCETKEQIDRWFEYLRKHPEIEGVELYKANAEMPWWLAQYCKQALDGLDRPVSMMVTETALWDKDFENTPVNLDRRAEAILLDLDLAKFLDAGIIRYAGVRGWGPGVSWYSLNSLVRTSAEILSRVLPVFASHNVKLVIENHPDDVAGIKRYFDQLFRQVPDATLGLNFDFFNCLANPSEDPPETWLMDENITRRIYCCHVGNGYISEHDITKGQLKDGILDIKELLRLLKQTGYDNWLSFEYSGQDIEETSRSVLYLQRLIKEI